MINGIINVYKEAGWTSNDVVCRLRSILRQKKIGHTGTLDPDAVGVLPVCLGHGTKLCDLLTDHEKEYEAQLRLGITTDTLDLSGEVLEEREVTATEEEVIQAVLSMIGSYDQVPPMYSARKVNGKKLYEYARAGIEVERKSKRVTIADIKILSVALPDITFRVRCSKGTYIRSLCEDIGKKLGCGGAMAKLTRTRVGMFAIDQALTLKEVERMVSDQSLMSHITPVDSQFTEYAATLPKSDKVWALLKNGNAVKPNMLRPREEERLTEMGDHVRIYSPEGEFMALYEFDAPKGIYKPFKMFM